jgi:manganese-transporting P-type ATPase
MALQCLISSYSLSVLYLAGVKYGDQQMTALGLLGSVSFMSVSRSRPLDKLSKVQPLSSIFHPASFISLLGQFALHLFTMVVAVRRAKSYLPEDYSADLDGEFKPGILNTVVFLVSSVQQVTVFFVNMQGRPFMTGISENRPLLWSLAGTFILTFMFASETVPEMNRYFQLVSFPDDTFRSFILKILLLDLAGTFLFDRVMKLVFAREIFIAAIKETRTQDIFVLMRTFAFIGFLMYQFLGSSEQWEVMIAMEEKLRNGGVNVTDLIDNATTCVEGVCDAVNDTVIGSVSSFLDDEF